MELQLAAKTMACYCPPQAERSATSSRLHHAKVVLVWVAFLLLRCSGKKGRSTLKGTVSVQAEGHATVKGGYIIYFLWHPPTAPALPPFPPCPS